MRFLYVTDLHGDTFKYQNIFDIAVTNGYQMIVNGGDMLPRRGERHKAQKEFLQGYLDDYFTKMDQAGIINFAMLGNNDLQCLEEDFNDLCQAHLSLTNLAGSKAEYDGYEFIGMNHICETPSKCKDHVSFEHGKAAIPGRDGSAVVSTENGWEKIKDWNNYYHNELSSMKSGLEALPEPDDSAKTIYVIHMPPAGLGLDVSHSGCIGSSDVYDFIEKRQPMASLHGHVHESPSISGVSVAEVGDTICVQPGQQKWGTSELNYVEVSINEIPGSDMYWRKVTPCVSVTQ